MAEKRTLWIVLLLIVVTLGIYAQVLGDQFIGLDDRDYFTQNPFVANGLSWEGVGWAFREAHLVYWHPLTTISFMVDCQLYGVDPGKMALVNACLHALASVLLFFALRSLTRSFWASAFVALAFSFHPLRVESVAWVGQRKDVLSAVFFALSLWAYARYARRRGWRTYLLLALAVAGGMLSKPTFVTVPVLLFLLDVWPLGRWAAPGAWKVLVVEKLPLLAMSAVCALMTASSSAQSAVFHERSFELLPLATRMSSALEAYVAYLGKIGWPAGLTVFYPHPAIVTPDEYVRFGPRAILSGLLLAAVTAAAVLRLRRAPYLAVGWFWFLGLLFPVIGLTQSGGQFIADRFTYLPMIGLLVGVTWWLREWIETRPGLRRPAFAAAGVLLAIYAYRSHAETRYWTDGETLYRRGLELQEHNYIAHANLGWIYLDRGRLQDAERELELALEIRPDIPVVQSNLGLVYGRTGRKELARNAFQRAIGLQPSYAEAHNNLGVTLEALGDFAGAIEHYREALRLGPPAPNVANNLAWLLATTPDPALRDGAEAVRWAEVATRANGHRSPAYLETLAAAHAEAGDFEAAVRWQREALARLPPASPARLQARRRLTLYESKKPLGLGP